MSVLLRKKFRRAVSPVIAVVLLIALSVAAAAVVWGIFGGFSDSNAALIIENTEFSDINGNQRSDQIVFTLRNIGSEDAEITSISFATAGQVYNNWFKESGGVISPQSTGLITFRTIDPNQELVSNNEVIVTITTSSNAVLQEILKIPTGYLSTQIGEAGSIVVGGTQVTVSLNGTYVDPVVVAVPVASSSATVRGGTNAAQTAIITEVTTTSFKIVQRGSQADTDGVTSTTVNYIVMEKGVHYVRSLKIQVGTFTVSGVMTNYTFLENFTNVPTVLASTQTNANAGVPHSRGDLVTGSIVQLLLENGDLNPPVSYTETVGYIAIEQGSDTESGLQAYTTADSFKDTWKTIPYNIFYIDAPIVISHLTNYDGADESYMAIATITSINFEVSIEETTARDGPHTTETVSWLAVPAGSIQGSTA